jgi:hypothetical protein
LFFHFFIFIVYYLNSTGESPGVKYNDIYTGSAYTSGADIATAIATDILTMLEVDPTGHVVLVKEAILASDDIYS